MTVPFVRSPPSWYPSPLTRSARACAIYYLLVELIDVDVAKTVFELCGGALPERLR